MKGMILSRPGSDNAERERQRSRFETMINAAAYGGIECDFFFVEDEATLLELLGKNDPDLVFSASMCVAGADGFGKNVHEILENLGCPYVGSVPEVLELVLSKADLKSEWKRSGVCTPEFFTVKKDSSGAIEGLGPLISALDFPYIVKPGKEGNSRGIDVDSVVRTRGALVKKVMETVDRYGDVIIERFLGDAADFREFTVAMLGNGDGVLVFPVEIVLLSHKLRRVVTNTDKDEHLTKAVPVAEPRLRKQICRFARRALQVAGVRDYARCDILYADGSWHAIEINGQPMLPDPWFEACARNGGMDETQYINALFLATLARLSAEKRRDAGTLKEIQSVVPPEVYKRLLGGDRARIGRL